MTSAVHTHPTAPFGDRILMEQYSEILEALTALSREEGALLSQSDLPLPLRLIHRKEALTLDYALMTTEVRNRALALRDSGLLDPQDLEPRIRTLVAQLKENQRHLNARKVVTAHRVEMVMKALAANSDRDDKIVAPLSGGPNGTHAPLHRA
ncbi:MAG: hypothetical protein K9H25_09775 [Rhodospirillum sp.]|nr:hypothetical protein [Rhodospirillum sp.]MCF8491691.1 hypothetical protein [Rhodospirillum sp.]MCF8501080.1 hypothetical protein [Rhodospirillum sp.]